MKDMIGVGKGTCTLEDFDHADLIVVIGQNRPAIIPHDGALHRAERRGATVIALNPSTNWGSATSPIPKKWRACSPGGSRVARKVYRVRIGGDLAAPAG